METQTQQADLDPGTFEMHHRGLEVSFFFSVLLDPRQGEPSCRLFVRLAALETPFFSTSTHLTLMRLLICVVFPLLAMTWTGIIGVDRVGPCYSPTRRWRATHPISEADDLRVTYG